MYIQREWKEYRRFKTSQTTRNTLPKRNSVGRPRHFDKALNKELNNGYCLAKSALVAKTRYSRCNLYKDRNIELMERSISYSDFSRSVIAPIGHIFILIPYLRYSFS